MFVVIEGECFPIKKLTPEIKTRVSRESLDVYTLGSTNLLFKLQKDLTWREIEELPQDIFSNLDTYQEAFS